MDLPTLVARETYNQSLCHSPMEPRLVVQRGSALGNLLHLKSRLLVVRMGWKLKLKFTWLREWSSWLQWPDSPDVPKGMWKSREDSQSIEIQHGLSLRGLKTWFIIIPKMIGYINTFYGHVYVHQHHHHHHLLRSFYRLRASKSHSKNHQGFSFFASASAWLIFSAASWSSAFFLAEKNDHQDPSANLMVARCSSISDQAVLEKGGRSEFTNGFFHATRHWKWSVVTPTLQRTDQSPMGPMHYWDVSGLFMNWGPLLRCIQCIHDSED